MNHVFRFFLIGIVLFCFFPHLSYGNMPTNEILPIIKQGISYLSLQDYEAADSCWKSIPDSSDYELERLFFPALTTVAEYGDLERPVIEHDDFIAMMESAEEKAKERLKTDERDLYARLFLGYTYGFLSMYYYYTRSIPSVLAYGLKAVSELKKCIEIDPTFKEPYINVGAYKYWKSSFFKKLYIPFFGSGRDEGIEIVKKGINSPLGDYLARTQLGWIYLNYKKYDLAIDLCEESLKKYPTNRIFMWIKAYGLAGKKNYDDALDAYYSIVRSLKDDGYQEENVYYKTHFYIAQLLYKKENFSKSHSICNYILDAKPDGKLNRRQKRIFKKTKKLLEKCEEKLDEQKHGELHTTVGSIK